MIIVVYLLQALIVAVWVGILARVLLSWIDPAQMKPISRAVYKYTEPLLAPIRNALPRTGQLDLAPLVLLLGLGVVMRVVLSL